MTRRAPEVFLDDSFVLGVRPEVRDMSAVWHDAGRHHLCVRHHSTYKEMVMSRRNANCMVAETIQTRRKVKELEDDPKHLGGRGRSRRR